jgi:PAS domain-containing protein
VKNVKNNSSIKPDKNPREIDRAILKRRLETIQNEFHDTRMQFEHILDLMTNGLRIINRDFTIKTVNKAFADMYGINPQDAPGKKCYEVF